MISKFESQLPVNWKPGIPYKMGTLVRFMNEIYIASEDITDNIIPVSSSDLSSDSDISSEFIIQLESDYESRYGIKLEQNKGSWIRMR